MGQRGNSVLSEFLPSGFESRDRPSSVEPFSLCTLDSFPVFFRILGWPTALNPTKIDPPL